MANDSSTSGAAASITGDASRSMATSSGSSSSIATSKKAADASTVDHEAHQEGQASSNGGPIACNGCHLSLEETSDTVVVSFGDGLWHVDCFRCAKCNNLVEHDTNLLLLADGSPVCEGCSYVCSFCGRSISNEAIVTGDESYHADCFRCKACSTRIEELVFAKTSQGIYCMACHNERVARTRKHAESKRNRSLRRNHRQGSSGQGSSSSRKASSSHQASTSSLQPDARNGSGDGSLTPQSPYADGQSAPNSAHSASAGHAQSSIRTGSGDADGNANLPEPPASLKKLRGMDKSPRLGDKESLHPKPQDQSRLHTSPRHGQEALYMSPSASSDKTLPAVDIEVERSGSSTSMHQASSASTRKPSEEDLSRTLSANHDPTSQRHNYPALNIPRSTSPTPSVRAASPTIPASSPTNTNFTQIHSNGLAAPRANAGRNANRRSGFYGVMALPSGSTSPTGSGSVTPVLQDDLQASDNQDGYFANASGRSAHDRDTEAMHAQDDMVMEEKALPVQPLSITRAQNGAGRAATPSSSLSSVNTSGAGSSSSLSIPSTSSHTPQTLSASSSAGKNNHLSFYDPDVLVFLDAVNDGSGQKRAVAQGHSTLHDKDSLSVHTPTRPIDTARNSASSTMAEDGYSSDTTPDTTLRDRSELHEPHIRSRSLSPNPDKQRYSLTPSPRQPRDLNLVANGHISTFSASTNDEDEERELLSPLSTRRRSSNANNGLGLSTASSQRSNKSTFGLVDDEEEDESTKTALRKVRESIRQSRGASMSSVGIDSPAASASGMTLDIELVELLIKELEETKNRMKELQKNYNAIRRASRQAFEGFSLAREEYDREVQARREAEYEMIRLKKELQEQASKLSALNEAQAKQEHLTRQSQDLRNSVVDIEQELRKMKIERDLTYAEMEELAATAKTGPDSVKLPERLSVALDNRLSTLKETYRQELEALSEERDTLKAEVEELQQAKDLFNDEGNELNKRNADLSEDITEALKQLESVKAATAVAQNQLSALKEQAGLLQKHINTGNPGSPATKQRMNVLPPPSRSDSVPQPKAVSNLSSSVASSSSLRPGPNAAPTSRSDTPPHVLPSNDAQSATIVQKIDHVAPHATVRKFKWGSKKGLERPLNASISKHPALTPRGHALELSARQHNFQPISILRPVRCESCGDKMWGMGEQRCHACGIYCHSKCAPTFNMICNSAVVVEEPDNRAGAMSMFGNDLVAQCLNENRLVPMVVVKCIEAVEETGIQYEGIYRKSGGMGQTKLISACFDRGEPFDLGDQDRFNDISAVTSVLKNYFRNLPNPLYTFEFHQDFCSLPSIKESDVRLSKLEDLLHCLPEQHYATLRMLMLHLHRIHRSSSENKMTPANLGVVFGPTLLRSPDPSQEFSQMHLKARVVELTVENAPLLFEEA